MSTREKARFIARTLFLPRLLSYATRVKKELESNAKCNRFVGGKILYQCEEYASMTSCEFFTKCEVSLRNM